MKFKTRAEWGARPRRSKVALAVANPTEFYVHYGTGRTPVGVNAESAVLRDYQDFHMDDKGWSDIAYSWAVGQSGTIYELRGWGVAGGHTNGRNHVSHAVVWIGGDGVPTQEALASINEVIAECERRYGKQTVRPHQAVVKTSCPGLPLMDWLSKGRPVGAVAVGGDMVASLNDTIGLGDKGAGVKALQQLLNSQGYAVAIDGDFGPKTQTALKAYQARLGVTADGVWGPLTRAAHSVAEARSQEPVAPVVPPAPPAAPEPVPAPVVTIPAPVVEIDPDGVLARLDGIEASLATATITIDAVAEAIISKLLAEGMLIRA